ncbi:MAG: T9SS type A sorting domain-containing protein [Bacteroidota bacterium]
MRNFITILILIISFSLSSLSQNFNQIQKIVASDRASGDVFGLAVSISGNYGIVGAQNEKEDATGGNTLTYAGSAYIFELDNNGHWNQTQKLVPSDRSANDYFGGAVSINGNRAIVGAFEKDAIGGITYSHAGAAYIFERDGNGIWNEVKKLVAADTGTGDHFGYTVSISGTRAIVGSPIDSEDANGSNTINSSGSAYIFELDGNNNWMQTQKIVAADRAAADLYGASVSISGDYVIIGSYQEDENPFGTNSINNAGSAYIFERNGNGIWIQTQKIVSSDRAISDRFGISVSISGQYAVVGAYLEDEDELGFNTRSAAGSAYIFERDGNGNWIQAKKITASDRDPNDNFGQAVSIDGNYVVVGAQNEAADINGANIRTSAGGIYLFKRNGNGIWNSIQKIVTSDRATSDFFGTSVSISNGYILAGAHLEDEDIAGGNQLISAGSAYIFQACQQSVSTINPAVCRTYTSPSGNYTWTSTGTYLDTIPNKTGCDSVITIHLTVNSSTNTLFPTACYSYTSPSGKYNWTNPGTYRDTIQNFKNCDSIITIHLTMKNSSSALHKTECNNYTSPSGKHSWSSSGTYLDTIPNSENCDSLITIHLTINSSYSTLSPAACNTYTSPSGNYVWTNSGTYSDTLINWKGCDSVMTIHLTINTLATSSTINQTACISYTSLSGKYTWNNPGTYMDTIPNMAGCDSVITIHLTINTVSTSSTLNQTVCASYTSPSGNYTWTSSGIYMDTIPNTDGCDSIMTIHLTVNNTYSTLNETTCYSYTSPSGNYTWNNSGTYSDTLSNAVGCDSIITVHLLINTTYSTTNQTACYSYTSPSGNYIWTISNTYTDTIPNTANCDSILTIHLTINSVSTTVTQNGNILTAVSGNTYQWLECGNGNTLLNGETNQSYSALNSGNYAVIITNNGCTDTSACYYIGSVGLLNNEFENNISILPNPANTSVTILSGLLNNENITIELINTAGQVVYSQNEKKHNPNKAILEIETADLKNGIYFIIIQNGTKQIKNKLIITH